MGHNSLYALYIADKERNDFETKSYQIHKNLK